MITTVLIIVLIIIAIINVWLTLTKKDIGELKEKLIKIDSDLSRIDPLIRDEFGRSRDESQKAFRENREELNSSFKFLGDNLTKTVTDLSSAQKSQFEIFSKQLKDFNDLQKQKFDDLVNRQESIKRETEEKLKEIRETVEGKLKSIQDENNKKLEEMRKTVDEKLQETVEKRFNESFKLISERLEQVHKGLGEMQTLASGVGDLKKILTDVKIRGNLGEIQLGRILEQILSPDQYEKNAIVKEGSQEKVDYAIKLPDKNNDNKFLLLPIDSKFPIEDYQRLIDAYNDTAKSRDIEAIAKQLENSVKQNAKSIKEKYINPPVTTDFAIMFVPTEGLYAEILRRTGLFEDLQRNYKVTVVGPTNLVAFLSSLQMGFKTLAIEKRSSEVWELLGAVKTQFAKFGEALEKTKKKLQEATNEIERAGNRSKDIEKKLRMVQELPKNQTVALLGEAIEIEQDNNTDEIKAQLPTAVWRNGGYSASYDSFVVGLSAVLR